MSFIYEVILSSFAVLDSEAVIELGLGNCILRKKGPYNVEFQVCYYCYGKLPS